MRRGRFPVRQPSGKQNTIQIYSSFLSAGVTGGRGAVFFVLLNVRRKLYGNMDGRRPDVRRAVNSDSIEHLTVFVYGAGSFFLIRYLHWCVSVFIHIYGYIVTGSFAAV